MADPQLQQDGLYELSVQNHELRVFNDNDSDLFVHVFTIIKYNETISHKFMLCRL